MMVSFEVLPSPVGPGASTSKIENGASSIVWVSSSERLRSLMGR